MGNNNQEESDIKEFYRGLSIFITGATGLMGKVLIEKLLYSCEGIEFIYVLMRKKRGRSMQDRVDTLISSQVFDRIRENCPKRLKKVVAVEGDITFPGLGLVERDLKLLIDNVSVIFHAAATVKFDDPLRTSIIINLQGTKHVVEIARKMNLKSFVHVSTAYSNCDRPEIDEVVYPPKVSPGHALDMLEWMDDNVMDTITPNLIEGRPNTYTLTKAITESYLEECAKDLPICIIRPSIVTASWKDPVPGWVDSLNGATAVYLAMLTGTMKTFLLKKNAVADFIPVDVVINLMIASAWYTSTTPRENGEEVQVINCTSGNVNGLTWGNVETFTLKTINQYPSIRLQRYPGFVSTSNSTVYILKILCQHYLPAAFIDAQRICSGKPPRTVQFIRKTVKAMVSLYFFTTNSWRFLSKNNSAIYLKMSEEDRQEFNFNIEKLDWSDYIEKHVVGVKKFILKEDDSKLQEARNKMRSLHRKDVATNLLACAVFMCLLLHQRARVSNMVTSMSSFVLRILGLI